MLCQVQGALGVGGQGMEVGPWEWGPMGGGQGVVGQAWGPRGWGWGPGGKR